VLAQSMRKLPLFAGFIAVSAVMSLTVLAILPPVAFAANLSKMSSNDRAYLARGCAQREHKDPDAAVVQFDLIKHPELGSNFELANMADSYNSVNRGDKALSLINVVIARIGDDKKLNCPASGPYPLAVRGDAYLALHRPDEAAADNIKVAGLCADGGKMYLTKAADILRHDKKYPRAIVVFDRALKLPAQHDDVLLRVGRGCCFSEMKKYDAAIADFSEGIKLADQPGRTNDKTILWSTTLCLTERAKCYEKLGKFTAANQDKARRDKMSRSVEDELYGK
jgi:tetratricopeptide (TPR) repeat protein